MKKISKTEFNKIKNRDWLIAIDKKNKSRYDIYMNMKILNKEDEKFMFNFIPNVKTENNFEKDKKEFFKDLAHEGYDFFILNKKEINKRKAELILKELKK